MTVPSGHNEKKYVVDDGQVFPLVTEMLGFGGILWDIINSFTADHTPNAVLKPTEVSNPSQMTILIPEM